MAGTVGEAGVGRRPIPPNDAPLQGPRTTLTTPYQVQKMFDRVNADIQAECDPVRVAGSRC
jgi:hypothetical protein